MLENKYLSPFVSYRFNFFTSLRVTFNYIVIIQWYSLLFLHTFIITLESNTVKVRSHLYINSWRCNVFMDRYFSVIDT